MKLVANNKKARHDYFIEETYEAGISLTGTEIKSVRQGRVSIKESYAKIEGEEVILYGMNISPYFAAVSAMLSPWLASQMAGSATPWMYLPRSQGCSRSILAISRNC